MDFAERVVIQTAGQEWQPSPMPGVWRKPLAREEAERGHATSIVKYEPGARFSAHPHPLGEEILVLEGTFSDQTGDYAAGTYFRNPEGFTHAPFSEEGCVLLVKLHQFQPGDDGHVVIDTKASPWKHLNDTAKVMPLHEFGDERVMLFDLSAFEPSGSHVHVGGEEFYVLSGEACDEYGRYPAGTWVRNPHLSEHNPWVEREAMLWVKLGHLRPAGV
jgi:anti-sigma factor ChrR (cupin superfamily)